MGAGRSEASAKFYFTGDLRDVAVVGRLVEGELGELQKLLPRQEALSKLMELTRSSAQASSAITRRTRGQSKGRAAKSRRQAVASRGIPGGGSCALASALQWATAAGLQFVVQPLFALPH